MMKIMVFGLLINSRERVSMSEEAEWPGRVEKREEKVEASIRLKSGYWTATKVPVKLVLAGS
jgi:hypothetical protein